MKRGQIVPRSRRGGALSRREQGWGARGKRPRERRRRLCLPLDITIVAPGNNKVIYQELAGSYAAIEPPIWAGLLASGLRNSGYSVRIIDQEAEGKTSEEIVRDVSEEPSRMVAVVVYGQQPSASTQNMTAAQEVCRALKEENAARPVVILGGHPSALPKRTLRETAADFVAQGEGLDTLEGLLGCDRLDDPVKLSRIPGLWYRSNGEEVFTHPAPMIPQRDLSRRLPGIAWDLLPMKAYRAHNWHCFTHIMERRPYASLYTSLGCPFTCSFCCINAPFEKPALRCWEPEFVIREFEVLAERYGVRNIKIADEMFVLNPHHVLGLCELLIERDYGFNIWAYARVDTVQDRFLEKLEKAGFHWLCLGIESKSQHVRSGVEKDRFHEEDIVPIVRKIQGAGINVLGNFIFGLPDEDYDSMQATFDLAVELNCEWANFYCAMAYPGSALYRYAVEKGWELPKHWHDFSQHSYEMLPLPTEHVPAGEVIGFRDEAWHLYYTNPSYLAMVERKFGQEVLEHLKELTKIRLKRKYLIPPKKGVILTV
ncbi:MAG: radical SAM protein [Candidatus Hydrogenedentota bacterium]|nr:MAG: radical SAM protein [Candidatus Hydrogenedentota bacterium]